MAFGKLYTYEKNPRSTAIRAVAKANDLQLDVVEVDVTNPTADYLKLNKLGKVPTFEGEDGFVLYECMAIAIYSESPWLCLLFSYWNDPAPQCDEYPPFFQKKKGILCYPWLNTFFVENETSDRNGN